MNKVNISWLDIKQRVEEIKAKFNILPSDRFYGVPRGGQPIAAMFNPCDKPEQADYIIDDLIDSGATEKHYKKHFPEKPFIALFQKHDKNDWFTFPWELKNETAEDNFTRILQALGEDTQREGLKETPKRYMKFLNEFLSPEPFNFTTFSSEGMDEMIVQKNIPFYSLCEHHIAPFFGTAHVAYIPNGKIVGLSKLARTIDKFARRLQNQERITSQVAEELQENLNAKGVAVVISAQHLCMAMRGIKKHDTFTTTSKMLGFFKDDLNARQEFLNLIK